MKSFLVHIGILCVNWIGGALPQKIRKGKCRIGGMLILQGCGLVPLLAEEG